jgi:hypothetical protein
MYVQQYERLIEQASHARLRLSYAKFMQTCGEADARNVYEKAARALKDRMVEQGSDSELGRADRVQLLDAWCSWEQSLVRPGDGDSTLVDRVTSQPYTSRSGSFGGCYMLPMGIPPS